LVAFAAPAELNGQVGAGERRGGDRSARLRRDLPDLIGSHALRQIDRNGVADIGADLIHGRAAAAVEHVLTVERSLRRDARNFRDLLLHFLVKRGAIRGAVRAVGRFYREGTDALQVVGQRRQRTAGRLGFGDGVIRIVDGLIRAVDLSRELAADRETGRIVGRAVDAQTRGKTLQRLRQ
jgi:hypothetical protein